MCRALRLNGLNCSGYLGTCRAERRIRWAPGDWPAGAALGNVKGVWNVPRKLPPQEAVYPFFLMPLH